MTHISEILAKVTPTPSDGFKTNAGEMTTRTRLEAQVNQPENQNLAVCNAPLKAPALSESKESKDKLDNLLMGCFTLQKIYGKEPESYTVINNLFHSLLAQYPANKVTKALETWLGRSQEFPTPADIIGLIRRNGKPPLKESDIIAIRKKDGEDRTAGEWETLRAWDEQQQEGWREFTDSKKDAATLAENIKLRQQILELERENARVWDIVKKQNHQLSHIKNSLPAVSIETPDKIQRTIATMISEGASQELINEFKQSVAA